MSRVAVAVVGAGITGLVAAHSLRRAGVEVAVLESAREPGGKVLTRALAGLPVECGPDAFLLPDSRLPELCAELGLAGSLVNPALGGAAIYARGRLRPIPAGLAMGVPTRPLSLAASGILSPAGAARAGLDLVLPRTAVDDRTSVAELIRGRFGREAKEQLLDPLLGGVYAGDTDRLGLADVLPEVHAAASRGRSLLLGLRRRRRPTGPVFASLRGGLQELTAVLAAGLGPAVRSSTAALSVSRRGSGFEVETATETISAEVVVLATPAFVSAGLIKNLDASAAALLDSIDHVGVATIGLAFPAGALPATGTSGFLVPPKAGRLITAGTWVSEKWPELAANGVRIVRCSAGRAGDQRWAALSDGELADRVRADLAAVAGVTGEPLEVRVTRWERALPQYEAGHRSRLADLEGRLARFPGLLLAGAAYRGIGLTACARQAFAAAEAATGLLRGVPV